MKTLDAEFQQLIKKYGLLEKLKEALKPARATGALERSLKETFSRDGHEYTYTLDALSYYKKLKQGVGTPPDSGFTIQEANSWRLAKGLNISPFAIARNINRFGTRAHQGTNPFYDDPIGETLTDELIQEIILDLERLFNKAVSIDGLTNF